MLVLAALGLDPWDVLHQGLVAAASGSASGPWAIIVERRRAAAVDPAAPAARASARSPTPSSSALVMDLVLAHVRTPDALGARVALLVGGVVLNGIATGMYIGAGMGPGPRDGLTTGLAARGHSIRVVRTTIEVTVLVAGFALGGTVGIGTLLYALAIGPISHVTIPALAVKSRPAADAVGDDLRHGSSFRRGARRDLFPLDGAGRLRRDVEHDPVDLAQLADHARRDLLEQVVGQARPVGGHGVVAGDRADDDDVAVGALVALHADRADVGQHAEGLPQLAVQAGVADLVLQDVVGVAQEVEALLGGLAADDADRQAGPRERLAPDEALGQAELGADRADLVLEQRAQRLDELELEVLGQAADVVVAT